MKRWSLRIGKYIFVINVFHLIIFLIFFFSLSFFSLFNIFHFYKNIVNKTEVKKENNKLKRLQWAMDSLKKEIANTEFTLSEIIKLDIKERLIWGLQLLPSDLLEVGTGGSPFSSPIEKKLMKLENLLNFEMKSFTEIYKKIRTQMKILQHTPSILPTQGELSCGYGWRYINGRKDFHEAIDIANEKGALVFATADGIVSNVFWYSGLGLTIEISHGYGYVTRYAHLLRALVSLGQFVSRGQVIGEVGVTGFATGPHLHYEVHFLGKRMNPSHYIISDTITF